MNIVNQKGKKINKVLSTLLEAVNSFVIIATTSSSVTLTIAGFELIVIPISTGIACGLHLTTKVFMKYQWTNMIIKKLLWESSTNY